MLGNLNHQQDHLLVDLGDQIKAKTTIPITHHAALRAGFAGYPPNPRWNVTKFQAWKTGQRWQHALQIGDMIIRSQDQMLVFNNEQEKQSTDQPISTNCFKFSVWAKQLITNQLSFIS